MLASFFTSAKTAKRYSNQKQEIVASFVLTDRPLARPSRRGVKALVAETERIMNMKTYDVVVIGSGMAGMTIARKCAAKEKRVAITDSRPYGGACALRGCDPKKVLLITFNVHRKYTIIYSPRKSFFFFPGIAMDYPTTDQCRGN